MSTRRLALLAIAALAAPAAADELVYSTTFENGVGPEWTLPTNTTAPTFTRFLGRFSNATAVELVLDDPFPDSVTGGAGGSGFSALMLFDFYCIDSWDGDANYGPDRFMVFVNGVRQLNHTFANQHDLQSYPLAPTVGRAPLGFTAQHNDSIYRDIAIPFEPGSNPELRVRFYGETMQGMNDESWGIDNVRIYWNPVPSPGTLALLGLGGLLCARRKR
jgi:hypothetical protein